jgi:hypothetical protein
MILERKPTWLARGIGEGDISNPAFPSRQLEGIHRSSAPFSELDIVFFNSPGRSVTNRGLAATIATFPDTISTTRPTRHVAIESDEDLWMSSHTDSDLDNLRRRFLEGCIINWYDFTSQLWPQLQRQVVAPNYNGGFYKDFTLNDAFSAAAHGFLPLLLPTSSLLCISHLKGSHMKMQISS